MHLASMIRMEWFVENCLNAPSQMSVLDVGSCNVNGTYKELFDSHKFKYTGLDICEGPNVDIVVKNPYRWDMIPDESYDVVISGQAFEHIEFFWFTMGEMARVLKRGGLTCIIAPRNIYRHRYPIDTYRFDTDGMIAIARYANLKPLHVSMNLAPLGASPIWYSNANGDSMLIAAKPSDWSGIIDVSTYSYEPADIDALATGFVTEEEQALADLMRGVRKSPGDPPTV